MIETTDTLVDEALGKLLGQFKGRARIEALLAILAQPFQDLEDSARQLLTQRLVDNAVGEQLDVLGRIVRQPRDGRDDDTYRLWIRARTKLNLSSGTGPQILEIVALVLPDNEFHLINSPPASFSLEAHGAVDVALVEAVAEILREAADAGVRSELISSAEDDATTFSFSDDDTASASDLQGFGDDLDALEGGAFADTQGI